MEKMPHQSDFLHLKAAPLKITLALGGFHIPFANIHNLKKLRHFRESVSVLSCRVLDEKIGLFLDSFMAGCRDFLDSPLVAWQPHRLHPTEK